jgi:glyoxalase family protein
MHHLSAMSSDAQDTIDFFAGILRLPLLKQTVNYDDPGTYHLYFGHPDLQIGTMTFFVWPGAQRGQIGRGGTSRASFALSSEAEFDHWELWLARNGIPTKTKSRATGVPILQFEDPDGLRLELEGPRGSSKSQAAAASDGEVGASAAAPPPLGALGQVTVIVTNLERSSAFYADLLGIDVEAQDAIDANGSTNLDTDQYNAPRENMTPVVLLQADAATPPFRLGAGLTHHFALQVTDCSGLVAWRDFLNDSGVPTTEVKDRRYFQSIYFRDPDGHVLEIATTGPGFAVDEPMTHLGERLALPPWLEDRRPEIARRLPPLNPHPSTRV